MGREDRHDIVFFERNGLRHGEFGIRANDLGLGTKTEGNEWKWGYKVRELSWSCDSNVLGIWIERDAGDIGQSWCYVHELSLLITFIVQLWTTRNYHWLAIYNA